MSVLGILIIFLLIIYSKDEKVILQANNLLIYTYLIFFAPMYWRSTSLLFVGRLFNYEDFARGVNYTAISLIILCFVYQFLPVSFRYRSQGLDSRAYFIPNYYFYIVLSFVLSSLLTLFLFGFDNSLSKFLYQTADLGIPMTTLLVLSKSYKKAIAMGSFYAFFAFYTGFRYKLYFLALPLISCFLLADGFSRFRKIKLISLLKSRLVLSSIIFLPTALFILSVMTITRIKASDTSLFDNIISLVSTISSPDLYDQIGYGFFAETNILFAMSAVLSDYHVDLVDLSNLGDSILSHFSVLLPSTLRFDYDYLNLNSLVLQILGTKEALRSGTAYPLLGYINLIFSHDISFFVYSIYVFCVAILFINLLGVALKNSYYSLRLGLSSRYFTKEYYLVLSVATTGTLGSLAYLIIFRGFAPEMLKTLLVIVAGYIIINFPITKRFKFKS